MRLTAARIAIALVVVCLAPLFAQQVERPVAVPRLVRVIGSFHPANGLPVGPTESATLSIYKDEQSQTPLWQETQNVAVDAEGHYTAMLGATQNDGVPVELFSSPEARWLGVQFNRSGETEQPRVQLVSVPYALRASDAETLGGRPASAYLLDSNAAFTGSASTEDTAASSAGAKSLKPRTISGSMNYLPYFTDSNNDLGNSVVYQSGNNVGIGTTSPNAGLVVYGSNGFRVTGSGLANYFTAPLSGIAVAGTADPSTLELRTNNTPRIDILSSGNVGIGTASPDSGLVVYGSNGFRVTGPGLANYYMTPLAGTAIVGTADPSALELRTNNTPRIDITSSGNVGIGTTTPGAPLEVVGNLEISGTGHSLIFPDGTQQTTAATPSGGIANFLPYWISPSVLGNSVLYQSAAGNVGVGTTTPGSELDVAGNINFGGNLLVQGMPAIQLNGNSSISVGLGALGSTSGLGNVAMGADAMYSNSSGAGNTAVGYSSMKSNTTGGYNTAVGMEALFSNWTTTDNTAIGASALFQNDTGNQNTAVGSQALSGNTPGDLNIAVGYRAGFGMTGSDNTVIGSEAMQYIPAGTNNIALGYQAGSNRTLAIQNAIYIGSQGLDSDANGTMRMGTSGTQTSFFAAGVNGVQTGLNNAVPVLIDGNGQLGTMNSSRRYKEDIQDMGDASSGLMRLRPVTFRYKKTFDNGSKPIQYGLIAEEVAEVYPDLVARSADGQIETVKYQVLDSMLLNEVQRQEKVINAQAKQIELLEERLSKLEAAAAGSR
jgi:hypothetical protein